MITSNYEAFFFICTNETRPTLTFYGIIFFIPCHHCGVLRRTDTQAKGSRPTTPHHYNATPIQAEERLTKLIIDCHPIHTHKPPHHTLSIPSHFLSRHISPPTTSYIHFYLFSIKNVFEEVEQFLLHARTREVKQDSRILFSFYTEALLRGLTFKGNPIFWHIVSRIIVSFYHFTLLIFLVRHCLV